MNSWLLKTLPGLLEFPVDEQLVEYIIQIKDAELDDHLKSFLDITNSKHKHFITELKRRRAGVSTASTKNDDRRGEWNQNARKKKGKSKENIPAVRETPQPAEKVEKKKTTKFVNLYSQEGKDRETVMLKGRHRCDCEAKTHALVSNCSNCGRIVCAQEGAGPCFFCDQLVCSTADRAILSSNNTKQAASLYNKLMDRKIVKLADDAVKHRDRLLEYDRNSARRTRVIDDENDYYQANDSKWLSKKERELMQKREEEARQKKYESRLAMKVTFDFAGRQIVEETPDLDNPSDFFDTAESAESMIARVSNETNICPTIEFDRPTYIEMNPLRSNIQSDSTNRIENRIQDKEYLEMVDEGVCLSMHQPYASLLVAGIKRHEGRTWYSSHRGRLWIAAASKVPATEEISTIENNYRALYNENIKFPANYPTGCLLGCVTVTDVLPQEEYRRIYPSGESDSPYVFICQDSIELPLKFPIQGKHKIYKLDKTYHRAAVKCLERALKTSAS